MKYAGWVVAALLLVAVALLAGILIGTGRSRSQPGPVVAEPNREIPAPPRDTVAAFVTHARTVLNQLEKEAQDLHEQAPEPGPEEYGGEGPEYFVMFYYWLEEARRAIDSADSMPFGPRFGPMALKVEERLDSARRALADARRSISADRKR